MQTVLQRKGEKNVASSDKQYSIIKAEPVRQRLKPSLY